MHDWKAFFERVYVINLQRREDRLKRFEQHLQQYNWPFKKPERIEAIDGKLCRAPLWWQQGGGAWGCYRSHLRIIEDCLNSQVESVLILEDDATMTDDFSEKVQKYLSNVPDNWDMIYLGGEHLRARKQSPTVINSEVARAYNINRTHAYAVRGKMLPILYRHLLPAEWRKGHHIDHHYGVLHEQQTYNIYTPTKWLVGQADGVSSINGRKNHLRFWNAEDNKLSDANKRTFVAVVGLHSSGSSCLAGVLHHLGLHLGNKFTGYYGRNPEKNCGFEAVELMRICEHVIPFPTTDYRERSAHSSKLRHWIRQKQIEAQRMGTIAGGKYPQLCRLGDELLEICGDGLKVISIDRPLSESVESMFKRLRGKHSFEKILAHQQWLAEGKSNLLEKAPHKLHINYSELLSNPSLCVQRICQFLDIKPTPEQLEKAVAWVKPEKRHVDHSQEPSFDNCDQNSQVVSNFDKASYKAIDSEVEVQ